MKNYCITLLLTLLIWNVSLSPLAAQNSRGPAVEALNEYVSYMNETIHALMMYRYLVKEFNSDLNMYTYLNYNYDRGSYWGPYRFFRDAYGGDFYYSVKPAEIQAKLEANKALPPAQKQSLMKAFQDFRAVIQQMETLSNRIENYHGQEAFRQDDSLKAGYALLHLFPQLFDDFDQKKEALRKQVEDIYQKNYPPSAGTTLTQAAQMWGEFIRVNRKMVKEIRYEKPENIDIAPELSELKRILAEIKAQEESLIQSVKRYGPNHGKDPKLRMKFCFGSAEAIITHAERYLSYPEKHASFRGYPKEYHFYNKKLLNKLNRYGMGLVQSLNKLFRLSNAPLLEAVEEPHSFMPKPPKPPRKESSTEPKPKTSPKPQPEITVRKEDKNPLETFSEESSTLAGAAPNNLVFLLDVSASMDAPEKLPLLKSAFRYLVELMRPEDYVSIVTYSGKASLALPATSAKYKDIILASIEELRSGGGTEAQAGLDLAYDIAQKNFIKKGNNRILLASDGAFELPNRYTHKIAKNANKDLHLSVFYLGKRASAKLQRSLLELAQLGQGEYYFLKAENARRHLFEEARKIH